jgi:hypothetical protein
MIDRRWFMIIALNLWVFVIGINFSFRSLLFLVMAGLGCMRIENGFCLWLARFSISTSRASLDSRNRGLMSGWFCYYIGLMIGGWDGELMLLARCCISLMAVDGSRGYILLRVIGMGWFLSSSGLGWMSRRYLCLICWIGCGLRCGFVLWGWCWVGNLGFLLRRG